MFFGFYKYSCVSFCRWACQDLILLYTRTECVAIVNYLHLLNDRVVAVSYTLYWMTVRLCSVLQRRISMWYCLQIRLLSCLPFCLFVYFVLTMYLRGLSRLKNEWRNEGTNEGRNYLAQGMAINEKETERLHRFLQWVRMFGGFYLTDCILYKHWSQKCKTVFLKTFNLNVFRNTVFQKSRI